MNRRFSHLVEYTGSGQTDIVIEHVYLDLISNVEEFKDFSRRKEEFNSVMTRLGLPYRFKWVWEPCNIEETFDVVVNDERPPSLSWWQNNFYFLNRSDYSHFSMAFCSPNSNYQQFWPFIQSFYRWMRGHKRNEIDLLQHPQYWEKLEQFFTSVSILLEGERDEVVVGDMVREMEELTSYRDRIRMGIWDSNGPRFEEPPTAKYESHVVHAWYWIMQYIKYVLLNVGKERRLDEGS